MKSPMIERADYIPAEEKGQYSELQVLHSAAGYYIGTIATDPDGFQEPGSRDSDYFTTEARAQRYLDMVEKSKNPQEHLFDEPQSNLDWVRHG